MKNRIFELLIALAVVSYLVWCIYPAFNCEGTIVRGLVRLECIK